MDGCPVAQHTGKLSGKLATRPQLWQDWTSTGPALGQHWTRNHSTPNKLARSTGTRFIISIRHLKPSQAIRGSDSSCTRIEKNRCSLVQTPSTPSPITHHPLLNSSMRPPPLATRSATRCTRASQASTFRSSLPSNLQVGNGLAMDWQVLGARTSGDQPS